MEKPKKKKPSRYKDNREWISVPLTPQQKEAVKRAALRKGLNVANYGRMRMIEGTDYEPKDDPDINRLLHDDAERKIDPALKKT